MNKRSKESFVRRLIRTRLFVTAAFIVLAFVALGYARAYYQNYKIHQEITALQEEVKNLETKKIESLKLLQYVTSDQFVGEAARTELNLKLPGEQVVVVQQEASFDAIDTSDSVTDIPSYLSNPVQWWYYISHQ